MAALAAHWVDRVLPEVGLRQGGGDRPVGASSTTGPAPGPGAEAHRAGAASDPSLPAEACNGEGSGRGALVLNDRRAALRICAEYQRPLPCSRQPRALRPATGPGAAHRQLNIHPAAQHLAGLACRGAYRAPQDDRHAPSKTDKPSLLGMCLRAFWAPRSAGLSFRGRGTLEVGYSVVHESGLCDRKPGASAVLGQ